MKKEPSSGTGPESDGSGLVSPAGTELERVLAIGPQSAVFIVRGEQRLVCKRLVQRALASEAARASIRREGAMLDGLRGRGTARLLKRGEDDAHGPYLLLEYVEAPELSGGLRGLALGDVARACFAALAQVHDADDERGALGIVHGDVTPGNVLVDATRAVLVDFGLAMGRDWPPSPDTGTFRGTFRFAAPESARGEPLDARSDLFSMAASLLSVATGSEAREAAHPAALLVEAGSAPLDGLLARARASLDPGIVEVLASCAAFERAERPESARAVHAALGLC